MPNFNIGKWAAAYYDSSVRGIDIPLLMIGLSDKGNEKVRLKDEVTQPLRTLDKAYCS